MIWDIILNFVIFMLFGCLVATTLILYRIKAVFRVRMKALDILDKKLDALIADHLCSSEDIHIAYKTLDDPSYNSMLYAHLEKWKLKDFYPHLVEIERQ